MGEAITKKTQWVEAMTICNYGVTARAPRQAWERGLGRATAKQNNAGHDRRGGANAQHTSIGRPRRNGALNAWPAVQYLSTHLVGNVLTNAHTRGFSSRGVTMNCRAGRMQQVWVQSER